MILPMIQMRECVINWVFNGVVKQSRFENAWIQIADKSLLVWDSYTESREAKSVIFVYAPDVWKSVC